MNGEYARAFDNSLFENITTKFYKPNTATEKPYLGFHLPYYLMNLDEWLGFLLASERTQKPFWDKVLQECFKFYKIFSSDVDEAKEEFVNYFKWKFRYILANIVSQVDSDTAKITAAKGIIIKCKEINAAYKYEELSEFLTVLDTKCNISFGNNNNELATYLDEIEINDDKAIKTDSLRLKAGEYFDYKFLKTAVDIVLLDEEAKGNSRIREFTSTMLSRLDYFITNPDCDFMRYNDVKYDNTNDYLEKVFGIGATKESQLLVVDSSEVGTDALELMTGVISRMIFDNKKYRIGDERRKNPVHLILDEAHRYIKKDHDYLLRENIFERIAREGRKFSLYLIISSQRPSELSPTVLSQCGNYIIHRIQNEVDMRFIYSVLPFFSDDYTIKIKQQVPGEALVFGNCVPMPLHIKINEASPAPNSENCNISIEWFGN